MSSAPSDLFKSPRLGTTYNSPVQMFDLLSRRPQSSFINLAIVSEPLRAIRARSGVRRLD